MLARGIAGIGIAAAVTLGVTVSGSAKTSGSPLSGHVALPAAGQGLVDEFTVDATAPSGKLGALRVRSTNDAQLPPGIRAMAAVAPASSKQRSGKFTVYIAVNNLTPASRDAHAAAEPPLDFQVLFGSTGIVYKERVIHLKALNCEQLKNESTNIDAGVTNGTASVQRLRRTSVEPSEPESVFDFSAANAAEHHKPPCPVGPGGVEPPDPGDT